MEIYNVAAQTSQAVLLKKGSQIAEPLIYGQPLKSESSRAGQRRLKSENVFAEKTVVNAALLRQPVEWTIRNATNHPVSIEIRKELYLGSDKEKGRIIILQPNEAFIAQIESADSQGNFYFAMEFLDDANFWVTRQAISLSDQKAVCVSIVEQEGRAGDEFWPPVEWIDPRMVIQK